MLKLTDTSKFTDMVKTAIETAATEFGSGGTEHKAVKDAWKAVGF